MTTNRYDPAPDAPHGHCLNCPAAFDTEAAANEHMSKTRAKAKSRGAGERSHQIRITNPSRDHRISRHISGIVDDAIEGAMCELDRIVERNDATEAEISRALQAWPDFHEFRDDWTADGVA
jgi:protein subunit release factor A